MTSAGSPREHFKERKQEESLRALLEPLSCLEFVRFDDDADLPEPPDVFQRIVHVDAVPHSTMSREGGVLDWLDQQMSEAGIEHVCHLVLWPSLPCARIRLKAGAWRELWKALDTHELIVLRQAPSRMVVGITEEEHSYQSFFLDLTETQIEGA